MTTANSRVNFVERFATIAPRFDVLLCDVWGVVHNSIVASPEAHDALSRFRKQGGAVVLITNAPRPAGEVQGMLDRLKVPRDAYDSIVTSGDVTRLVMASRPAKNIFHLGPKRDLPLFEGMGTTFVSHEDADYIVCTGLFDDETETAETYRPLLEKSRARNMFMLCANPDLVVERGTRLIYCAGAIADLYQHMGGDVLYAGKPHAPIYEETLRRARQALGRETPRERVLAIGDSLRTDMKGAKDFGVGSLFVTGGIHAEEVGTREAPDEKLVLKAFEKHGVTPDAVTRMLAW